MSQGHNSISESIKQKIAEHFAPTQLTLINDSHKHAGATPTSETHFTLILASDVFVGDTLVARHKKVYSILAEEFSAGVHALALHLFTNAEWTAMSEADKIHIGASPECMHKE